MNIAKLLVTIAAVDGTSKVFKSVAGGLKKTTAEVKTLWKEGQKLNATMKGLGKLGGAAGATFGTLAGAAGVYNIVGGLADAQEGFNKIQVLGSKSKEQMETFRREIYAIAAETARGPEEILAAAIDKVGEGLSDKDIFATLRKEGLYATASFSKNMANISAATLKMSRLMKMDLDTATGAFAGIHEIMKGEGKLGFEGFMAASEGIMRDAGSIMGSKSGKGNEGIIQIAAATKIASRTMGADEAMSAAEAFFSDLEKAKTEGSLQKVAGIDLGALREKAKGDGDAIGTIVDELLHSLPLIQYIDDYANRTSYCSINPLRRLYETLRGVGFSEISRCGCCTC